MKLSEQQEQLAAIINRHNSLCRQLRDLDAAADADDAIVADDADDVE